MNDLEALADFLDARVVEDEEIARAAVNSTGEWVVTNPIGGDPSCGQGIAEPMNVARVFQNAQGRPWVMEWEVLSAERGDSLEILFETEPDAADMSRELAHIAYWDPARVLAECAAKRQIAAHLRAAIADAAGARRTLERAGPDDRYAGALDLAATRTRQAVECIAKHVAQVYADHEQFREEWQE